MEHRRSRYLEKGFDAGERLKHYNPHWLIPWHVIVQKRPWKKSEMRANRAKLVDCARSISLTESVDRLGGCGCILFSCQLFSTCCCIQLIQIFGGQTNSCVSVGKAMHQVAIICILASLPLYPPFWVHHAIGRTWQFFALPKKRPESGEFVCDTNGRRSGGGWIDTGALPGASVKCCVGKCH